MKYSQLLQNLKNPIFSLHDLAMLGQKAIPSQISNFAKNGDIIRLKNGLYLIASRKNDVVSEYAASRLYDPSYVSLEWALYKHGLMPDIPFSVTSVTTKTTRDFQTPIGLFIYRSVKPDLFFGYEKKEDVLGQPYLLALPEKALLDYLYLNLSRLHDCEDIDGLRLDPFTMKELDAKILREYARVFDDPHLDSLISCLPLNK
jgi:predicted transcriptional regulator of viral defense system